MRLLPFRIGMSNQGRGCAAESPAAGTSADIGAPASGPGRCSIQALSVFPSTACHSSRVTRVCGAPGPLPQLRLTQARGRRSVAFDNPPRPLSSKRQPNIPRSRSVPAGGSPPGKSSLGPPAAPHEAVIVARFFRTANLVCNPRTIVSASATWSGLIP